VFPHTANAIMKDQIAALGGTVVGEEYVRLGAMAVEPLVGHIVESRPDVILNTINGDSNLAFFRALRAAGVTPDKTPTMSFSVAEHELQSLNAAEMAGDYAAWNYFQSIDSPANRAFVDGFRSKYGAHRVTDDPIESAYSAVYLWAQAVEDAGETDVSAIRRAIKRQSALGPEGSVYIDPENQHAWKNVRIGKIRADGQFDIVWNSRAPIRPMPYPIFRTHEEWDQFLDDLFRHWGGKWAAPTDES
jgi:urea transport system substrate-binding protein